MLGVVWWQKWQGEVRKKLKHWKRALERAITRVAMAKKRHGRWKDPSDTWAEAKVKNARNKVKAAKDMYKKLTKEARGEPSLAQDALAKA